MNVLFRRNMAMVSTKTIIELPNKYLDISHTSLTSGCRRQNLLYSMLAKDFSAIFQSLSHQRIKEVYRTKAATAIVHIKPGMSPRIEYDHGNDMIAKQIYSRNNRAAV